MAIANPPHQPRETTADLVRDAVAEIREVVRTEVALARDEALTELVRARMAAIQLGIAAGAALLAMSMFLVALVAAFEPMWLAALVAGGVVLMVGGALGYGGYRMLPKKPLHETVVRATTNVEELREHIA
jgi:predicted phage tail protein